MHTAAEVPAARRMAYRLSAGLSDRVTAVSEAVAARCGEDGIASAERAVVMPNGIDTEVWKPDERARDFVRAELGLRDEFLWCSVGRLEPVKDHALLLRAFAMLPKRAALAIAGSGALEGSLRELARDLAIAERVHFVGFQPDVRRWVQAADGVVLTSRWEGLPLNLLEAGACAVPCVATDVAGVRDVVEDGATGLLAEARSPDAVAAQMRRLMEMPREERAGMGERARRRVVDRFGLERVLDGWERLYGELLAANPRARRFAIRLRQGGLSVAEGAD
jgi:glycosyltransferase involved in cell wall biosynthesis